MAKNKKQAGAVQNEATNDEDYKNLGKITTDFKLNKVTAQGAIRYEEEIEEGATVQVGTIYIQKGVMLEPPPDRIRITIETL